jgi:antitoxin YefM
LYNAVPLLEVVVLVYTYSELRAHLKARLDEVAATRTPMLVTRQNGAPAVILDKEEYDGMVETLHLLRSPANAARLLASIAEANAGTWTSEARPDATGA